MSHPFFFIGVNRFALLKEGGLCLGQLFSETSYQLLLQTFYFVLGCCSSHYGGLGRSGGLIDESTQWGFGFGFFLFCFSLDVRGGRGFGGGFLGFGSPFGGRRPRPGRCFDDVVAHSLWKSCFDDVLLLDENFAWSPATATLTRYWRRRGCCARDGSSLGAYSDVINAL